MKRRTPQEILIEYNGQKMNIKDWSRYIGISYGALYSRIIIKKWDIAKALTSPIIDKSYKEINPDNPESLIGMPEFPIMIKRLDDIIKKDKQGYTVYIKRGLFKCECSNEFTATIESVKYGHKRSCGCIRPKIGNLRKSSEYHIWKGMRGRCNNPSNPAYDRYGGRGITVCSRWMNENKGFLNFLEDVGERPGLEYSIERINNDKGYYKENCKWATKTEQANNRRSNKYVEYRGEMKTIAEWSETVNIPYGTLISRYKNGWSIEDAIETPNLKNTSLKKYKNSI